MYDINPSGGGPILTNKLWFYVSGRWQTNQFYIPGSVGNANAGDPTKWLWVADDSVRGKFNTTQNSGSVRLTYQANPKHKFSFSHEPQSRHWIDATRGDLARVVHRLPVPHPAVHLGGLDGAAHQQAARDREVGRSRRRRSATASRRTRRTTR